MSTKTLTSLALLKTTIDAGGDYLNYLRPFVLHVLNRTDETLVTPDALAQAILRDFGMVIPSSIFSIVLRRITKHHKLRRNGPAFEKLGPLPNPRLQRRQADAHRHINSIVSDLQEYSKSTPYPLESDDAAVAAICTFLSHFDITCLRMYLRRTALPPITDPSDTDIVLVSDYVNYIHTKSPTRFDSFIVLVQGHMLANALTCPDLGNAPRDYKKTTFYLDTPILVRLIGAEGPEKRDSASHLLHLVMQLGGRFAMFTHTCDETKHVLLNTTKHFDSPKGRGPIIAAVRRGHVTKADLHLMAVNFEERLHAQGIQTHPTPKYQSEYQIDEPVLETQLRSAIAYFNPNAAHYDVNSVRSVYVLRKNSQPRSLESARAVFVTSNGAFASVAWEYGKQVEASREVSSVITDFTLANTAWLKAPTGAPDVPTTQVLAFSFAALQPSEELLERFLEEADRLEKEGRLAPRDHQLLRSSPHLERDVMRLTMGSTDAVTEEAIIAARDRAVADVTKEESDKRLREEEEHRSTQSLLNNERSQRQGMLKNVYWACRKQAERMARTAAILAAVFVVALEATSVWQAFATSGNTKWWVVAGALFVDGLALLDFFFGTTLQKLYRYVLEVVQRRLLKTQARRLGIEASDLSSQA